LSPRTEFELRVLDWRPRFRLEAGWQNFECTHCVMCSNTVRACSVSWCTSSQGLQVLIHQGKATTVHADSYHALVTTIRRVSIVNRGRSTTHIGLIPIIHYGRQALLLPFDLFRCPLLEPVGRVSAKCHLECEDGSPLLHLCSTISTHQHRTDSTDVITHLFSLPTLTVAIIFISGPQGSERAKHVNSKNDECSEYGTPTACISTTS
jgi:hypothetical protein